MSSSDTLFAFFYLEFCFDSYMQLFRIEIARTLCKSTADRKKMQLPILPSDDITKYIILHVDRKLLFKSNRYNDDDHTIWQDIYKCVIDCLPFLITVDKPQCLLHPRTILPGSWP